MHKCGNCGAEYNSNFLQCPQCGSSKYEEIEKNSAGESIVGVIISFIIIAGLIGLIAYGWYVYKHPHEEGPVMTDLNSDDYTTTTTETTTTISRSTSSTTSRTTTTKAVGEVYNSNGHSITLPEGFYGQTVNSSDIIGDNQICAFNSQEALNFYCFSIKEGFNVNPSTNKRELDALATSKGYSELQTNRFNGYLIYYFYKNSTNNYKDIIVYYNKGTNVIMSTVSIKTNEINSESMKTFTNILGTYK